MHKCIYVIDPRKHISRNSTAFERHKLYAQKLNEASLGKIRLTIVTFSFEKRSDYSDGELFFKSIQFQRLLFSKFTKGKESNVDKSVPSVVIAGDPWIAGISALLVSTQIQLNRNIQIQLHGDFGNPIWSKTNITNRIKFLIAKKVLRRADQIRCVSQDQATLAGKYLQVDSSRIIIAPVPMMLQSPSIFEERIRKGIPTLGLVGRIQADRGLGTFLWLLRELASANRMFEVEIIGSGPQREWLERKFASDIPNVNVRFIGELNSKEVGSYLRNIDVLVSCAPAESYGRAIREALYKGVPVWTTATSGVSALGEAINSGYVKIFDLKNDCLTLASQFDDLLSVKISRDFKSKIAIQDERNFENIIQNWISIVD